MGRGHRQSHLLAEQARQCGDLVGIEGWDFSIPSWQVYSKRSLVLRSVALCWEVSQRQQAVGSLAEVHVACLGDPSSVINKAADRCMIKRVCSVL